MLTLLAPTQSKEKLISSLKVTEAEWAEFESYMEDAGINVTDTAAAMNKLGLSVYDSTTGELKPAIQIIGERYLRCRNPKRMPCLEIFSASGQPQRR